MQIGCSQPRRVQHVFTEQWGVVREAENKATEADATKPARCGLLSSEFHPLIDPYASPA